MTEQKTELVEVKKIGEVEHIVHASGEWDGTGPVEFSNDGEVWLQAWAPTEDHPHPEYARVEVYRKDLRIPTTVTIRWDEQYPAASEKWSGMWDRSPMRHFGRTARMAGFRQTFRHLLGNIVIEDEGDDRSMPTPDAQPDADAEPAAARDYAKDLAAVADIAALDALEKNARSDRIFTPNAEGTALHMAFKARRRALASAAWTAPDAPDGAPAAVPARAARPAPRDYLPPANRAERRKAARKKGHRR